MNTEFFLAGWGLAYTIYVIVQLSALIGLRGKRRLIVLAPAPIMFGVLLWTVYAYRSDSNLWPIVMIFASPAAIVFVILIWAVMSIAQKREIGGLKAERGKP